MVKTNKVKINTIETSTGTRYILIDAGTGIIIDNAQGYGFKTPEAAVRYATSKGWMVINPPYVPEINPLF